MAGCSSFLRVVLNNAGGPRYLSKGCDFWDRDIRERRTRADHERLDILFKMWRGGSVNSNADLLELVVARVKQGDEGRSERGLLSDRSSILEIEGNVEQGTSIRSKVVSLDRQGLKRELFISGDVLARSEAGRRVDDVEWGCHGLFDVCSLRRGSLE